MANLGFLIKLAEGQLLPSRTKLGHFHFVSMGSSDPFGNTVNYSITDSRAVDRSITAPQVLTCNFSVSPSGGIASIQLLQYFSVQHGDFVQSNANDPFFNHLLQFFSELIGAPVVIYDVINGRYENIQPYVLESV